MVHFWALGALKLGIISCLFILAAQTADEAIPFVLELRLLGSFLFLRVCLKKLNNRPEDTATSRPHRWWGRHLLVADLLYSNGRSLHNVNLLSPTYMWQCLIILDKSLLFVGKPFWEFRICFKQGTPGAIQKIL